MHAVSAIPGHLGSFVRFLFSRRRRHDDDQSAVTELDWRAAGESLPAGLELEWLGTSGFRLSYQGRTLLIDPYVTRAPLADLAWGRRLRPSPEAIDRYVRAADAVLVGHTHFDHAVDVPAIAERRGCRVYGSRSLARLMALHGAPERAVEVEPYRVYEVGPFAVTFVPSRHSKLVLGLSVPFGGELTCEAVEELTAPAYRCGDCFGLHIEVAGVRLYHQGSADLVDEAVRHRGVDVFLCGVAGRRFTPRYLERILGRLEPRIVVPHHFDDFFRPLDAPMGFSVNVDVAGFVDEVRRVSADFTVRTVRPLRPV